MKKGRHRRFEEARAFKRSQDVDLARVFDDIAGQDEGEHKPEHDAWADLAEEWDAKPESDDSPVPETDVSDEADADADADESE